jgi:hypothetical protein
MSGVPAPYVKKPGKDFTRKEKLPFETVMQLLISMGGNSIYKELLESQGYDVNTATTSAFVQQGNKVLPSAAEFLYHEFTQSYTNNPFRDNHISIIITCIAHKLYKCDPPLASIN